MGFVVLIIILLLYLLIWKPVEDYVDRFGGYRRRRKRDD